jgi:arginine:ornithine antiporter/lysine permease
MIGAGVFSLSRTFAVASGPFGARIAGCVAAGGMYRLMRVFQSLAERKPDHDARDNAFARAGFGDYPDLLSAFVAARSHPAWQRKSVPSFDGWASIRRERSQ